MNINRFMYNLITMTKAFGIFILLALYVALIGGTILLLALYTSWLSLVLIPIVIIVYLTILVTIYDNI